MPEEITDVTCPWCHRKNLLLKRTTKGTYRCSHCQGKLLSDPFLSLSEQQVQASPSGGFSVRRIVGISILTVFAVFGLLVVVRGCSGEGQLSSLSSAPIASSSPTASPTLSSLTLRPKPKPKPKPVQRPTDDNGHPFPTKSGYLKGYPALLGGGYSSVTVDNSQNDSDVFVKLFSLNTTPPKAASVFFIRAHDSFTVENIKPGNYDVRYRDLKSRGLSRTEQFNLKEVRTARGVQFSRLTLTLYKVLDGNMEIQPIAEGEF